MIRVPSACSIARPTTSDRLTLWPCSGRERRAGSRCWFSSLLPCSECGGNLAIISGRTRRHARYAALGISTVAMTFIGTGSRENNMELADMDGDGKMDLVTNSAIFFQSNPHSWTTVTLNSSFKGLALLDIGSGQGSINVVGLGGTGPYSFVRQEGNSFAHLYSMITAAFVRGSTVQEK